MKYALIALTALTLAFAGCGKHDHSKHDHGTTDHTHGEKAKDPVCQMEIGKEGAKSSMHGSQTYYFCSQACQDKFKADPAKYVK